MLKSKVQNEIPQEGKKIEQMMGLKKKKKRKEDPVGGRLGALQW